MWNVCECIIKSYSIHSRCIYHLFIATLPFGILDATRKKIYVRRKDGDYKSNNGKKPCETREMDMIQHQQQQQQHSSTVKKKHEGVKCM